MRPSVSSDAFPSPDAAQLYCRIQSFSVWEAARPHRREHVRELNEHRALIAGMLRLGVSAERLRVQPVPDAVLLELHAELDSLRLA